MSKKAKESGSHGDCFNCGQPMHKITNGTKVCKVCGARKTKKGRKYYPDSEERGKCTLPEPRRRWVLHN